MTTPADIRDLHDQLDAAERDARALVDGLSEALGTKPRSDGGWSVSECLDHLAMSAHVYLPRLREAAERGRAQSRLRRSPVRPGVIGGWFVQMLEPGPKQRQKMRAPKKGRPRKGRPLRDSFDDFIATQAEVHAFLDSYGDLDLSHIRFRNPFISVIHFSLATGLNVLTAHARRHLLQAWRVRAEVTRTPGTT